MCTTTFPSPVVCVALGSATSSYGGDEARRRKGTIWRWALVVDCEFNLMECLREMRKSFFGFALPCADAGKITKTTINYARMGREFGIVA